MKKQLKLFNHSGKICKRCTCGRKEQMDKNKIKIAAIKFAGCASGGTEKNLQAILANLPKDKFAVDAFITNAAPYIGSDFKHINNDQRNIDYLKLNGVNVRMIKVDFKDVTKYNHPWIGTDLFDHFKEEDYDVILAARAGHSEYPFTEIKNTPIVEIINLPGHVDKQKNIVKHVHVSNYQIDLWSRMGGDVSKAVWIPVISEEIPKFKLDMRKELGIKEDDFVFGMLQRPNNEIFSPIALEAYKKIMSDKTWYIIMGGGDLYGDFAKKNNLKNFVQLPYSGDPTTKDKVLTTFNVFAHARNDGELCSLAISEALSYGLPVISHFAAANGQVESIGNAGKVCRTPDEYAQYMTNIMSDKEFYRTLSKNAKTRYEENYTIKLNINKYVKIFEEIVSEREKDKLSDEEFWKTL